MVNNHHLIKKNCIEFKYILGAEFKIHKYILFITYNSKIRWSLRMINTSLVFSTKLRKKTVAALWRHHYLSINFFFNSTKNLHLDSIMDDTDMNLSKLLDIVKDRETGMLWSMGLQSPVWLSDWMTNTTRVNYFFFFYILRWWLL